MGLFILWGFVFGLSSGADARYVNVTPQELYERTQSVLTHYNIPQEEDSEPFIADLQNVQSLSGIQKIIQVMDPHGVFDHLVNSSNKELDVYQDLDAKEKLDMQAALIANEVDPKIPLGQPNLRTSQQPLKGLRIAIDPGHMGGHYWDLITGKYVQDAKGGVVSEGVIALQTALLLKADLEKLGAQVLLTRETTDAVTSLDFNHFDLAPFARNELRESVHQPWFQSLLTTAPSGPALNAAFDQSAQRRKIYSSSARAYYFVLRADLAARSDAIAKFRPDIALVIHFDAAINHPDPKSPNETKAYVMGGYGRDEFASRADRKYFVRHILDRRSWNLSLDLTRQITHKFHDEMGLNLANRQGEGSPQVEPGIFSRNLGVTRRLTVPAVSYLECLFYNSTKEFPQFRNATHPMMINGQNVPYSDRVVQVAQSIRDGILEFAAKN